MKRIGMMKIKDILRHRHEFELPRAQIAAAVGVSTGTVSHVLARAEAAGCSWRLPSGLDDEALRARLYSAPDQDSDRTQRDWDAIVQALTAPRKRRRARLTRRQFWVEYRYEALAQGGKAYTETCPRPEQMSPAGRPTRWRAGRDLDRILDTPKRYGKTFTTKEACLAEAVETVIAIHREGWKDAGKSEK